MSGKMVDRAVERRQIAVQIELPEAERDYAHAEALAGYFSDRLRWATHRRRWMEIFQQGVWRPVEVEYVARLASETLRQHYAVEAGGTSDKAKMAELGKKLTEACTHARIEGALSFLKGFDDILTRPEQWDAWPWLLNVRNGTLDLKNWKFRVHAPEDLLTKQAAVDYDPQAQAPNWEKHISYFLPNANVRREAQRELGMALVGAVLDETLPIWYGTGANGKSTTSRVIMALLGDYAKRAAPNLLVRKRFEEHPTAIADLAGARLVFSLETDDGKRLAEALVKELTGGDVKKARYLYGDFFEFQQTFSLVLITNHRPQITGADLGIWRCIRLIPWAVKIPENEKLPQDEVVSILLSEASGILNWMLAGLRDWQHNSHWLADEVRAATDEYRAEQDVLGEFLAERCEFKPSFSVAKGDLYQAYQQWAAQNGEQAVSQTAFGSLLQQRGVASKRSGNARQYVGIRPKPS